MYRNYYDEYTKRAEKIASATHALPKETAERTERKQTNSFESQVNPAFQCKKPSNLFLGLKGDDILLGILILFLIKEEKADITLILALAFIFLSDLG